MTDVAYLAWRYLAYHKLKTTVLVASIAVIVYLPIGLNILVRRSAQELTARARTTPLLIGAKGSPLELVLNSLYLESDAPPATSYAEAKRVDDSGLGRAIPLYTRFRAREVPIVGTTVDYYGFRGLKMAQGRNMAMLGECVLGAKAAIALDASPGGFVMSSPESVFDIAGVYPLKMKVVGVLKPNGTPDDLAVFVDLKTAWVIEGLAHGHEDLSRPEAADGVLRREGRAIIANASVMQYNEITEENVDSFHFHGDPGDFPVTSVIVIPNDKKSGTVLQGRYLGDDEQVQVVRPAAVIEELLDTVLTVQRYVVAAMVVIGLATLGTVVLVFILSLQLRRREMETLHKIGGSRLHIISLIAAEIVGVLAAGFVLAAVLSILTNTFASAATRALVLWS